MPNYEILITASATVLVLEAEIEEKALEYATDCVQFGNFRLDEGIVKKELKTTEELESCRRNVDVIDSN